MKTSAGIVLWPAAMGLAVVVALLGRATPTQALPTFAKAYGLQCSACHTVPPQLNAYGRYIQRTGYSALERGVLKNVVPINFTEQVMYDSRGSYQPHQLQAGNLAIHAAGFLAPDLTYHIHQWIVQNDQPGGLDTLQVTYSGLFNKNGHLFLGKMSALPVPGPFSNQSDIAKYNSAELQVGEHMYQEDMMRWGTSLSYVHANLFLQASWLGSTGGYGGVSDFSNNTDKTFEWMAAYADPNRPLEAGVYGSVGSWPLAEGGVDHYNSFSLYVQRDPGPHFVPGVLALYQWAHDANPGLAAMGSGMASGMNTNLSILGGARSMPMQTQPPMLMLPAANSTAETFEVCEPLFNRGVIGLRQERTNNGLGQVNNSGNIDLSIRPLARYDYLHLFLEGALIQSSGPAWRGDLWWTVPL